MEIVFAGFGGQGVLTSGLVVANIAMHSGYRTLWSPAYGGAMRGGKAFSLVKFDNKDITAPAITKADVVVAMNLPSLDFANDLKEGGCLIINSDLVGEDADTRSDIEVIRMPVTTLAMDATGRAQAANIVTVGATLRKINVFDKDAAVSIMKDYFASKGKEKFNASNEAAFLAGYNYQA